MIKITPAHLVLWTNRNKPSWAKSVDIPAKASVDAIINERAYGRQKNFDIENAINLLELVQRNHDRASTYDKESHPDMVQYMIDFPKNTEGDRKRAKWYARWVRKIVRNRYAQLSFRD